MSRIDNIELYLFSVCRLISSRNAEDKRKVNGENRNINKFWKLITAIQHSALHSENIADVKCHSVFVYDCCIMGMTLSWRHKWQRTRIAASGFLQWMFLGCMHKDGCWTLKYAIRTRLKRRNLWDMFTRNGVINFESVL